MKKLILTSAVLFALSGSAFAATDFNYSGGSTADSQGGSVAISCGAGNTGGASLQGSNAFSTNTTGADASETNGPGTVDVTANTSSSGITVQDSYSATTGLANGSTGASTTQGGTANASANGSTADGDFYLGFNGVAGLEGGAAGVSGKADAAAKSTQASGAVSGATGNGSTFMVTSNQVGNNTFSGVDVDADANGPATSVDMATYAGSVGGHSGTTFGLQSGSAGSIGGTYGAQSGEAASDAQGGIIFGNVDFAGPSAVGGLGGAEAGSNANQGSAGVTFGIGNVAANTNTVNFAANSADAGVQGITTPTNGSTTVNTYGTENGIATTVSFNGAAGLGFANGGGLSLEGGFGNAAGGFTTLP